MTDVYALPPEMTGRIPAVPGLCTECLCDPRKLMFYRPAPSIVVAYCEHNFTGAVVNLADERPLWRAYAPVSQDEWREMLADTAALHLSRTQSKLD
ncbi:hypothetical protein FBR03_10070 [Betaproteobacteria bacterium PRO1]|nr:hypothetical protein [Betaproteobacteria bacterium PRO1]